MIGASKVIVVYMDAGNDGQRTADSATQDKKKKKEETRVSR